MKNLLLLLALAVPITAQSDPLKALEDLRIPVTPQTKAYVPNVPLEPLTLAERDIIAGIQLMDFAEKDCAANPRLQGCEIDLVRTRGKLYADAVRSPRIMQYLSIYYRSNPAQLHALSVVQNQRIIELLEALVKKPR